MKTDLFQSCVHIYLLKWPKPRTLAAFSPSAGENVGQQECSFNDFGDAKCYSHFGRQFGGFI